MNKPTYINGDYRKSEKFDDGSRLVLGTSGIGGVWGDVDGKQSIQKILYALENGVTVLDTAPSYKDGQKFVGKALQRWKGATPFISTKVGRLRGEDAHDMHLDYSPETMRESVLNSLEVMGIDHVDLLFLHEPQEVPMDNIDEILGTLQAFKEEGLTKRIGIGGNPEGDFWNYVSGEYFDVLSSFNRLDACNIRAFERQIPLIEQEGIALYAASPLHMGLFGSKFDEYASSKREADWIEDVHLRNGKKVNEIADQHNIQLSELAFRYLFSVKEADRVVIGPRSMEQVKSSLNYWKKGMLPEEVFDAITGVLTESQELDAQNY